MIKYLETQFQYGINLKVGLTLQVLIKRMPSDNVASCAICSEEISANIDHNKRAYIEQSAFFEFQCCHEFQFHDNCVKKMCRFCSQDISIIMPSRTIHTGADVVLTATMPCPICRTKIKLQRPLKKTQEIKNWKSFLDTHRPVALVDIFALERELISVNQVHDAECCVLNDYALLGLTFTFAGVSASTTLQACHMELYCLKMSEHLSFAILVIFNLLMCSAEYVFVVTTVVAHRCNHLGAMIQLVKLKTILANVLLFHIGVGTAVSFMLMLYQTIEWKNNECWKQLAVIEAALLSAVSLSCIIFCCLLSK